MASGDGWDTPLKEDRHGGRIRGAWPLPLLFERERIQTLASQDEGVRDIARRLGRRPSTISCELRRTGNQCGYQAGAAPEHATGLAERHRTSKLNGHLRINHPDHSFSPETI